MYDIEMEEENLYFCLHKIISSSLNLLFLKSVLMLYLHMLTLNFFRDGMKKLHAQIKKFCNTTEMGGLGIFMAIIMDYDG